MLVCHSTFRWWWYHWLLWILLHIVHLYTHTISLLFVTTVRTITCLCARYSSVETLTVLLLTLWFLAVACPVYMPVSWVTLQFQLILCCLDMILMAFLIITSITCAFRCTHFTCGETFTIHFETVCLLTCTSTFWVFFLSLNRLRFLQRLLLNQQPQRILLTDLLLLLKTLFKARKRQCWRIRNNVFISFD